MESRVAAQINRFRKEAGLFEQKNCEFSAKVLRGELKWILAKLMQYWRFLNPGSSFGCGIAQKSTE
jgi:hypothetical protein